MGNGFFLITGTSRGIGEALAKSILAKGNTVLGVSRNRSQRLISSNYYHLSFDLTETSEIDIIMEKLNDVVDNRHFDFVCLVNNASMVEPLKSIDKCSWNEIESHIKIGLIAPMILTSQFIRRFSNDQIRKKVAFISSGAAYTAASDMSIYCSAKAGINMFAQCVELEQRNRDNGFEVICIRPGMVDTSMQRIARSKTTDEFASGYLFKNAYEDGKLLNPDYVSEKIVMMLENKYEQWKFVTLSDV